MKSILVICLFVLLACDNVKTPESMNVICFDTESFVEFEGKANVNKEKAWGLQIEFCKKNKLEWGGALYFVIEGNYIFSDYAIPKMNRAGLNGIWVNANTGKVTRIENRTEVIQSDGYYWRGEIELQ